MTTGPQHYVLAEQILSRRLADGLSLARAQVHATLALAAATALSTGQDGELDDYLAWEKTAGEYSARRAAEQDDARQLHLAADCGCGDGDACPYGREMAAEASDYDIPDEYFDVLDPDDSTGKDTLVAEDLDGAL